MKGIAFRAFSFLSFSSRICVLLCFCVKPLVSGEHVCEHHRRCSRRYHPEDPDDRVHVNYVEDGRAPSIVSRCRRTTLLRSQKPAPSIVTAAIALPLEALQNATAGGADFCHARVRQERIRQELARTKQAENVRPEPCLSLVVSDDVLITRYSECPKREEPVNRTVKVR